MLLFVKRWLFSEWRLHRERRLVSRLLLLNDHLLSDLGLRREQLQPGGIHHVDVAPPAMVPPDRGRNRAELPRASLQGCG